MFRLILAITFLSICSDGFSQKAFGYDVPLKVESLIGDWTGTKVKKSVDFYYNASPNATHIRRTGLGIDIYCYENATFSFQNDSTGFFTLPVSQYCPKGDKVNFKYKLEAKAGYTGANYFLTLELENGQKNTSICTKNKKGLIAFAFYTTVTGKDKPYGYDFKQEENYQITLKPVKK
jgi:hypothetical protein